MLPNFPHYAFLHYAFLHNLFVRFQKKIIFAKPYI